MAINDISLTASARANLLSLQQTSSLLDRTQNRISTGRKVNSALDNATAYFSSKGFLNRADDLNRIKEGLSTSLQTLKQASNAIESITKIVQQAQGLVISAQQSNDATTRAGLAAQFNSLLDQLNGVVADATFNGTNLLVSGQSLAVNFNENNAAELTINGRPLDASATGLNIGVANGAWVGNSQIQASAGDLTAALVTLRTAAAEFGTNATIIQTRQDFTDELINVLSVASDNLILADTNEEGANMQALQARLQLGVVSLGISGEQAQAILRLF